MPDGENSGIDHADDDVIEEEEEEYELCETFKQLISVNGKQFVAVPDGMWNIDGYSAKLRWFYSVTFTVDDEVSSSDIVEAITRAGVEAEHIHSIQFCKFLIILGASPLLTSCRKKLF